MQLWREQQKLHPRPTIPTTLREYMETEVIADTFTKTANKREFIIFKDWVDEDKEEAMVMFMSDWGADILKHHSTWLFDGTYSACPVPFTQIYICLAAPEGQGQGIPVGWFLLPTTSCSRRSCKNLGASLIA